MKTSLYRAVAGSLFLLAAVTSTSLQAQIYTGQDVGTATTPAHHGGFTNNANGTISINGGGDDIWNNGDNFFYYYTSQSGLIWDARMRVMSFTGPDFWSKIELMVRRPSSVGTAPVGADPEMCVLGTQISQQNEVRAAWRGTRAAATSDTGGTGIAPGYPNRWFRIVRFNNIFNFYTGSDGQNWTLLRSHDTSTTADGFDGTPWEDPILLGAAVTAHNDGDANGATAVVSNIVVIPFTPPTAVGIVTQIQPATLTVRLSTEASFSFFATNNSNPNDILAMQYSWYKNNQLVSSNMGPHYTFLTTAADNNAPIYSVATVQGYPSLLVTSAVATLTVTPPANVYTNGLKREFFARATRQDVDNNTTLPARSISVVSQAQEPGGFGDNYTERFSGYFIPPTTAAYVFFVAADDDTDVYLNPAGTDPSGKQLIAQEPGYSGNLNWLTSGSNGAFDAQQKRSDQWSPDPLTITAVNPNGFYLTGGNSYYIESVHHNGGGGDNWAITYQTTNQIADPNWAINFNNGSNSVMTAANQNIAVITPPTTTLGWVFQPTNLTVFEGNNANFFSSATSDSEFGVLYRWYLNNGAGWAPYAGAVAANFTLPSVTRTYNGAQFYVVANTAEGGLSITSSVATLTVNQAVFEPGFAKDERWDGATRPQVEAGGLGDPGYTMAVPAFEVSVDNPGNVANFSRRVSGFFVPPANGLYVFFVNGDDDTDLFISTDNTPSNKRLIAQEVVWANPWQWLADGDNNGVGTAVNVAQKRSDQFVDPVTHTTLYSGGISLSGGQRYYFEADFHQGGGGANVEATYKLTTDSDPGNGADTHLKGNVIGINAVRCSYVAFTRHPSNTVVAPFGYVTFTASGTTDSKLAVGSVRGNEEGQTNNFIFYQWYKNGTAVAGANSSSYTFGPVIPSDNNAQITCQIRALGYADNALNPIWSNSLTGTLTISPSPVFEPGWAQVEWWGTGGPSRAGIEAGTFGPAQHIYATPEMVAPSGGGGNDYVNRVSGFFVPPLTTNYVFFMNSDDDADLFVSTNSSPAAKRLVATESGWAASTFNWGGTGGGGDSLSQRRSDSYIDPATGTTPFSTGIPMTAGQKYYIEGVHHQGGGGVYFAATYKIMNENDPVNGDDSRIIGNAIGFYASRIPWVAFLQEPQNQTVTSGGSSVTFTAKGTNAPSIDLGGSGDPTPTFTSPVYLMYQWYKNSTPIPGATRSSYTQTPVLPSDNNAVFTCGVRALGYADNSLNPIYSNSTPAVLTVITDTVPPSISYVGTFANTNLPTGQIIVDVTFSKWMNAASLSNATYSIPGVLITNISIAANHQTVQLLVDRMPTLPLNIIVSGAKDLSGNTIAANSAAPINALTLTTTDVGSLGADPSYPSFLWADAAGGFLVAAEGSDIWANADGFNFVWELKTNDFDVVVRQKSTTHTSNWSKGGLMVRETLDANSRNWNIVNDPDSADGIMAPDGSGFGANNVECNARVSTGGASGGWANGAGGIAPPYPNAWVRLKRVTIGGNTNILEAFRSTDGRNWALMASTDVSTNGDSTALPAAVYVGICTTAHNNDTLGLTQPPPFDPAYKYYNFAEYADYTSSYVLPASITIGRSGANVTISWSPAAGHLESSPAVSGPGVNWQPVTPNNNPSIIAIGPGPRYFRVVNP